MTADGARRFPVVSPHKGQSVLNLGHPERSKSRHRHPGAPGQQTPGLRSCVLQGGAPKVDSSPGSSGGPPSPRLSVVRSPSVRGHRAPPPEQKADPPPAGAPSRRSSLHPPFRVGPHSRPEPGAAYRSIWGCGRNPAANHVGPGPHRGVRVRRRPPPGPQPHSSRSGRVGRSPAMHQHGKPPGTARLGPTHRPGRGLLAAPNSPSHSGARSRGGKTAPPRSPRPQQSSHSALDTGPPASARPGTDLKSAPPEPVH
ncbi:hypothetical protein NDU88_008010 [Pleurodeles waltl]|uniref:Basic proline-rich protein-like n=1 Tax=Pleurodeles waltl TaxID=8319 RepID=A0AAV7N5R9_PLEWA|nr:hypothetical protein NDU88_008010 [Pleurodeles waltl]